MSEQIKLLEETIERLSDRIDFILNNSMLAKVNYDLRNDILAVCEERDKYMRKVGQLENKIRLMEVHL